MLCKRRTSIDEVTRLGMHEAEMETIAEYIARMLVEQAVPSEVGREVIEFRHAYQTLYFCFDHGLPPGVNCQARTVTIWHISLSAEYP